MKFIVWFFRVFVFLILLSFAVKNDQPIVLRYFFGYEWHTSLVLVLLVFFAVGVAVGVLAVLFSMLRQRREIAELKKKLRLNEKNKQTNQILPADLAD